MEEGPIARSPSEVTQLLDAVAGGSKSAAGELLPLVYGELRRLAAAYLRGERADHTLQATALVHEAYLKLADTRAAEWQDRAHFFAVAAQAMRRILVDHARAHGTIKRGGGGGEKQATRLDAAVALIQERAIDLEALDEALVRLAEIDAQKARIVELRFFGGMSVEEAAEVLGVSSRTVERDWTMARAWLRGHIGRGDEL
jgi:RNA polymerase sigma-70 factor (ECF subfamily)